MALSCIVSDKLNVKNGVTLKYGLEVIHAFNS